MKEIQKAVSETPWVVVFCIFHYYEAVDMGLSTSVQINYGE
jgi:hypothetical protein